MISKLLFRFRLIKILGKRDRRVPVLLSTDMITGVERILQHRHRFVTSYETNPYVFSLPGTGEKYLEGWTALKTTTKEIDRLQMPEAITSTNVRKYVATVSQVKLEIVSSRMTSIHNRPTITSCLPRIRNKEF